MTNRIAELTRELIVELDKYEANMKSTRKQFTPIMRYNNVIMTMYNSGYSAAKIRDVLWTKFKFKCNRSSVALMTKRLRYISSECD